MKRIRWIDRKFVFDFPVELFPEILCRFQGVPARAEDLIRGLPDSVLRLHDGAGWSIKQNIGHLLDLESLIDRRLDDYDAGRPTLHAADMSNAQTNEANYDDRPMGEILAAIRLARFALVERLSRVPDNCLARSSIHPRLNQPMRLVDLIWFSCEHDDYHLTRVAQIARHSK